MSVLVSYPQGATIAPRFCPFRQSRIRLWRTGRPATPRGRWAKISSLSTPLWITQTNHRCISFSSFLLHPPTFQMMMTSIQKHHQGGTPMDALIKLFSPMIAFVYHCFDRIVINGYLSMLSRPENVVYFFRKVVGVPSLTKEVLMERTQRYQAWVEAYARNHQIPLQWAETKVRKEEAVLPFLKAMERQNRFGVYFIFKSMEQGPTFRCLKPKFQTQDPNYTILRKTRPRFTHYYFYIRDSVLGPMAMRIATFLPFQTTYYLNGHHFLEREMIRSGVSFRKKDNAFLSVKDPKALQQATHRFTPELIQKRLDYWTFHLGPKFSEKERQAMKLHRFYALCQVEYCLNFIFQKSFPIRKLFRRSCELGLGLLTADKISQIFGQRITKKLHGKLQTTLERIQEGHYVLRAHFKNAFLKQYEKFQTFLRHELCSNDLKDFFLKKGLKNLSTVRTHFLTIVNRFTAFQAHTFQIHGDFPLFQRLALPITCGKTKIPGIKIHDTRMIRLMEILLHSGASTSWKTHDLHQSLIKQFDLSPKTYTLNQLRYDLRKMKAHGLIKREANHYQYRLTEKGIKVCLLFILFHQRICGPLAHSLFHHRLDTNIKPLTKLEAAYQKADKAIQKTIELLAA